MKIPALYPILDADCLQGLCEPERLLETLCAHALALHAAGCTVLQYRAKHLPVREALAQARELRRRLPQATLIMNDRADLCLAANFDGVHIGQEDLSPAGARTVVGGERMVGLSTHNPAQFAQALAEPVDYLAIGPVFGTVSKENPDPTIGLDGVREARRLLDTAGIVRPLVAIGGITRSNAASVFAAGATSVAVIGDISRAPSESAGEFFRLMM